MLDTISGPPLLRRVGEALYGPRWQSALAIDLDVSDRTMRRWVSGDPIPHGVWGELRLLTYSRGLVLIEISNELNGIATKHDLNTWAADRYRERGTAADPPSQDASAAAAEPGPDQREW